MKTKTLPRNEWPEFFENFSRRHQGELVTVEILGTDIGAQVQGRELAFEGILVEWDEALGDQIAIIIGAKPDNHVTHSIGRPAEVSLEQTDEGVDAALAIKSAEGVTALLRFSPMLPVMIDAAIAQRSLSDLSH